MFNASSSAPASPSASPSTSNSNHSLKLKLKPPKTLTPPLNPYSPQEIATYQKLDLALRSHPELAREGATLLNPKALARLVQGIKFFQDTHLGRLPTSKYADNKRWPLMKFPDEFFRMRKGDGPLFHLFVSAYRYKKEASWRQFDFQSKNRYNDNMALLKKIHKDLIADGHLKRPVIYLDQTVPQDKRAEYKATLRKFGGRVVKDIVGTGDQAPTHVVCWDAEEHDSPDTLDAEEKAGEMIEKMFLKTLTIVDPKAKPKKTGGIIETTMQDSKKKGGKIKFGKGGPPIVFEHPMAFVHWWYHPSSYDEWMPAADVAGADTDIPPRPPGGPWIVGCKFVRDVGRFNEWGTEADYAVSDYQNKVQAYPELEKKLMAEAKAREVTKPLKIRLSLSSRFDKTKKEQPAAEEKKPEPVVAEPEKKRKRKTNYSGMMPKQIFTGFYSDNNKKLKRTVYDGALRIPPGTIELVRNAIKDVKEKALDGIDSKFQLPDMDAMLRPSLDPMLSSDFSVTELHAGKNGTTLVTARRLVAPGIQPERIRGGGEEDVEMEDASQKSQPASTVPVVAQTVQPVPSGQPIPANPLASATTGAVPVQAAAIAPATTNMVITQQATPVPGVNVVAPPVQVPVIAATNVVQNQQPVPVPLVAAPPVQVPVIAATNAVQNQQPVPVPLVAAPPVQVPVIAVTNAVQSQRPVPVPLVAAAVNTVQIQPLAPAPAVAPVPVLVPVPTKLATTPLIAPAQTPQSTVNSTITGQPQAFTPMQLAQMSVKAPTAPAQPTAPINVAVTKPPLQNTLNPSVTGQVTNIAPSTQVPNVTSLPVASRIAIIMPPPQAPLNSAFPGQTPQPTRPLSAVTSIAPVSQVGTPTQNGSNAALSAAPTPTPKPVGFTVSNVAVMKTLSTQPDAKEAEKKPLAGDQEPTTNLPPWYGSKSVSNVEKTVLPEWFNYSAIHRTEASYITARERIINVARRSSNKYLTSTSVRRCVAGDAGSIMRLHRFLVTWGFINGSAIGDSAPLQVTKRSAPKSIPTLENKWTAQMTIALGLAVNEFSSKKRSIEAGAETKLQMDWDGVAKKVGKQVTPDECYQKFLSTDFNDDKLGSSNVKIVDLSATEDTSREDLIADLIDGVKPQVVQVVVEAALNATDGDVNAAKRAGVLGAISSQAAERAQKEEAATSHILQQILDLRMAKLENRLSLLDDLEGMLDAERMALELERRDLYTNRCRHWFNADT